MDEDIEQLKRENAALREELRSTRMALRQVTIVASGKLADSVAAGRMTASDAKTLTDKAVAFARDKLKGV